MVPAPGKKKGRYALSDADKQFIRNVIMESNNLDTVLPSYLGTADVLDMLTLGDQFFELESQFQRVLSVLQENRRNAYAQAFNSAAVCYRLMEAAGRQGVDGAGEAFASLKTYNTNKRGGGRASKSAPAVSGAANPAPANNLPALNSGNNGSDSGI